MTQIEATRDTFLDFWSQMAGRWGVSRTMAQLYAFLYSSTQPLDTDTIMARLDISRGNANINLHKLLDWGMIKKVPVANSRKDHFVAVTDIWELTAAIIQSRQALEISPIIQPLHDLARELRSNGASPEAETFAQRLEGMAEFTQLFERLIEILLPLLQRQNNAELKQFLAMTEAYVQGKQLG